MEAIKAHQFVVSFLAADVSRLSRTTYDGRLTRHLCTRHVDGYCAVDCWLLVSTKDRYIVVDGDQAESRHGV